MRKTNILQNFVEFGKGIYLREIWQVPSPEKFPKDGSANLDKLTKEIADICGRDIKIAIKGMDKLSFLGIQNAIERKELKLLKDLEMFRDFTISPILDIICWKNGADIAPEYLYERLGA